ncbi:REP-associated tyrosine transposase [Cognatiluteimonas telluris]|jgi:REP element-mobilizing transposase RayT|uniref:REP-associated tyrosine transposase n=1 Tax=Cognatiluteimonas telluris TaxID=1104775 RepID=UPI001A9C3F9A|nr:transposase [Lysobacter telluris]
MEPTIAMQRSGRRSPTGPAYLVTFGTDRRQLHFSDWDVAVDACRMLTARPAWEGSRLLAWTLMPDHWHGLVELHPQDSLSALVGRLKGRSARYLRQAHPQLGWIWARAFHEQALRAEEERVAVARHLVLHAVRAGLVRRAVEYPFWDAVWLLRQGVRAVSPAAAAWVPAREPAGLPVDFATNDIVLMPP